MSQRAEEERRERRRGDSRAHLLTLGRDRVNLVDEDDGGRVLLGLLERLAQVGLGLAGHLGHDLGPVDEEEEGARLVGDGARHERLARSRRAKHEDAARGLDADRLEELRVAERELDELADLGELLAAAADVVVPDVGQVVLLVLALDGLALGVDDRVLRDDAVLGRVRLDHLELDAPRRALCEERVALADGAVRLEEVRLEEDVEDVARETLDRVVKGEDVDALAVLDVVAGVDSADVGELDAEVVARDCVARGRRESARELLPVGERERTLVELDLALVDVLGRQHDQDCVSEREMVSLSSCVRVVGAC